MSIIAISLRPTPPTRAGCGLDELVDEGQGGGHAPGQWRVTGRCLQRVDTGHLGQRPGQPRHLRGQHFGVARRQLLAEVSDVFLCRDTVRYHWSMLVGTAADYLCFCTMLLTRGRLDGVRVLGRKTADYMTTNHLPTGGDLGDHGPPGLVRNLVRRARIRAWLLDSA